MVKKVLGQAVPGEIGEREGESDEAAGGSHCQQPAREPRPSPQATQLSGSLTGSDYSIENVLVYGSEL